jgi:hypothetical protein
MLFQSLECHAASPDTAPLRQYAQILEFVIRAVIKKFTDAQADSRPKN